MKRLIIQNWAKPKNAAADAQSHSELRQTLEELDGVTIVDLKPGEGLIEVAGKNAAGDAKLKSTVESALSKADSDWKVYEESIGNYKLPKTF
jgi:hypothetical protein